MNPSILTLAAVAVFLLVMCYVFEKSRISTKEIPLLVVLAALAALGRMPFAGIPNVQPTTFLVILSGYVFGSLPGFVVGAIAAFVSNLFIGQGPWTIWQMFAWGLCGMSAGWLAKINPKQPRLLLCGFGLAWGFLFGWIMNLWHWITFIFPLTFSSWLATNLTSLWLDIAHASINVILLALLGPPFLKILHPYRARLGK